MRMIYQNAAVVQVWLGEDTQDRLGDQAFQLLHMLKNACMSLGWDFNVPQLVVDPSVLSKHGVPDIDHPFWPAVGDLIERPWFGRAWIIQEVVVSQTAVLQLWPSVTSLE
jgi:hypothetical protein